MRRRPPDRRVIETRTLGSDPGARAAGPLPVHQPSRLRHPGARRQAERDLLRGVLPVRQHLLSGGGEPDRYAEALPLRPARSATRRTGSITWVRATTRRGWAAGRPAIRRAWSTGPISSASPGTARRSSTTRRAPTRPIRNQRRRHRLPSRRPAGGRTCGGRRRRGKRPARQDPGSGAKHRLQQFRPRPALDPRGRNLDLRVHRAGSRLLRFAGGQRAGSLLYHFRAVVAVASNWACRPASVAREAPDSR